MNRWFSFSRPIDIRICVGHPNEFSCLTITPFFNNSFVNSVALDSESQIVVIKFAMEGMYFTPMVSNCS